MAAAIREQYPNAEIAFTPSSGGRFEVTVDGVLVFSKAALGRHAQPGEVMRLIAENAG